MPRLRFRLDFKTSDLRSLDLPVEIRKPNATLIKTALTSTTIDLPVGEYYATVRLPGGQRLVAPFKLLDRSLLDTLEVVLAPDPEDASEHEWEEVSHFLGRPAAQELPPPPRLQRDRAFPPSLSASSKSTDEAAPRPSRVPHLCFYSGNVVRRLYAPEAPASVIVDTLAEPNRLVQFEVHPTSRLLIAQLVQPGGPVENIALPVSPEAGLRLVIDRGSSGEYRMEAHLKHHAADMLLQYSCNGATSTAATAGRSQAVDGEHLLREKMADPIAAAVGAYSILRIGDLARLHDWTAHLRERFAWLPDGAAIHGEHLARMGRHEAALDAFAQVPMRGLPFLSDGLFYAVERLKLYVSRTWKGKERVDADRAKVVLDELQPFATLMRRQRPISTYPGLDVAAPDTAPASESFTSAQSRDLQTWFSPYAQNDETRPGSPAEAVGG